MAREVITERDVQNARTRNAAAGTLASGTAEIPTADDYGDRLIKYIPSEVVGIYLCILGLLKAGGNKIPSITIGWIVFGLLLVLTPIYLWRVQRVKKYQQLTISTVSFAIWVFTLGGPFAQFTWYNTLYGALLLPIYTFAIAIYKADYKAEPRLP